MENDKHNNSFTRKALQNCWVHIQRSVNKFSSAFQQIKARNKSGKVEVDLINDAKHLYFDMVGSAFKMESV